MADWTTSNLWGARPASPAITVYTPSSSNFSYENAEVDKKARTFAELASNNLKPFQPQIQSPVPATVLFRNKDTMDQVAQVKNEPYMMPDKNDTESSASTIVHDAYASFGLLPSTKVKDETLIELFSEELTRDLAEKADLMVALGCVAADRDSAYLRGYLAAQEFWPTLSEAKTINKLYEDKALGSLVDAPEMQHNEEDDAAVKAPPSNDGTANAESNLSHEEYEYCPETEQADYLNDFPEMPVTAHSHFNNKLVRVILCGGWGEKMQMHVPSSIIDILLLHPSYKLLKAASRESGELDLGDIDVNSFEMLATGLMASDFYCCSFFEKLSSDDYRIPALFSLADQFHLGEVKDKLLKVFQNSACLGVFLTQAKRIYQTTAADASFREVFKQELEQWLSTSALITQQCSDRKWRMCTGDHKTMLLDAGEEPGIANDILTVLVTREMRQIVTETSDDARQDDVTTGINACDVPWPSTLPPALSVNDDDCLANEPGKASVEATSIIVYDLPQDVSHNQVYSCFKQYGRIKQIGIYACPDRTENDERKQAYVHFDSPAAVIVLQNQYHLVSPGSCHSLVTSTRDQIDQMPHDINWMFYDDIASVQYGWDVTNDVPPIPPPPPPGWDSIDNSFNNAANLKNEKCNQSIRLEVPPSSPLAAPANIGSWAGNLTHNVNTGLTAIALKDSCDYDCSVRFKAGDIIQNVTGMALPPRTTTDSMLPVALLGGTVDHNFGTFPASYVSFDTTIKFVRGRQVPKDLCANATKVIEYVWNCQLVGVKSDEGFDVRSIARATSLSSLEVATAAGELVKNGLIFEGNDDLSWTLTEPETAWEAGSKEPANSWGNVPPRPSDDGPGAW